MRKIKRPIPKKTKKREKKEKKNITQLFLFHLTRLRYDRVQIIKMIEIN